MYNNYIYKDYNKYLLEKYVVKPHKNSRYATQGVTKVNDAVFITYYDTDKLKNSIVDIVRNDKHVTLELDNKSHVGGISYSKEYNKVFISNNRFVNTYDLDEINNLNHGDTLRYENKIKVHEDVEIASYLTVFDNKLYIGRFNKDKATKLAIYNINDDGILFSNLIDVPFKKVQGLAIYKYQNNIYYLFSTSYGRSSTSSIIITKLIDNKFNKLKEIVIPSMCEQISINDKELMIAFESDCSKYNIPFITSSRSRMDNIMFLDIEKILADC